MEWFARLSNNETAFRSQRLRLLHRAVCLSSHRRWTSAQRRRAQCRVSSRPSGFCHRSAHFDSPQMTLTQMLSWIVHGRGIRHNTLPSSSAMEPARRLGRLFLHRGIADDFFDVNLLKWHAFSQHNRWLLVSNLCIRIVPHHRTTTRMRQKGLSQTGLNESCAPSGTQNTNSCSWYAGGASAVQFAARSSVCLPGASWWSLALFSPHCVSRRT